jgi:hypothetical protein
MNQTLKSLAGAVRVHRFYPREYVLCVAPQLFLISAFGAILLLMGTFTGTGFQKFSLSKHSVTRISQILTVRYSIILFRWTCLHEEKRDFEYVS